MDNQPKKKYSILVVNCNDKILTITTGSEFKINESKLKKNKYRENHLCNKWNI